MSTLDKLPDKQILDDFVEAKGGGLCGIMGDKYINNRNSNLSIQYTDANNLNGYAMMQKLPYKDFKYQDTSLDKGESTLQPILNTPEDSDHSYYIIYDNNYTNKCRDRTEQLALMPKKER